MKKLITFYLFLSLFSSYGQEQNGLAKDYNLNFAVPDHPAFFILDNNPSNIIKPGNSMELFSVLASNIISGNSFIVPKDLSIEFAPAQLLGYHKITFEDYRKRRALYDVKFSLGAKSVQKMDSVTNLALGLRLTWVNKASVHAAYDHVRNRMLAKDKFRENLEKRGEKFGDKPISLIGMAEDPMMQNYVDKLYEEDLRKEVSKSKDEFWNKFKLETSAAIKYSSPDSLIKAISFSKFQIWNSLALPIGKSSQLLIGANYALVRNDSLYFIKNDTGGFRIDTLKYFRHLPNLSARFYAGSNSLKAFIEGSAKYSTDRQMLYTLNMGAEFNIRDGIWAVLNAGNNWTKSTDKNNGLPPSTSKWFLKIDLRYHLGEKRKS